MENISYKVSLGGVISALCLMLMFTTALSPVFYLVMPIFSGMLILSVKFEAGNKWAMLAYGTVSILSMLITFNKESVMMFIMFFGYYPVIKEYIERIKMKLIRWLIKFGLYNIATISEMLMALYIFGITDMIDEMGEIGKYGALIMLSVSNLMFFVYDIAVENCEIIYKKWLRRKILLKK